MERKVLIYTLLFVEWISVTDSLFKDDGESIQRFKNALTDQKRKYDSWKVIKRTLTLNDKMRRLDTTKTHQRARKISQHQSDKDSLIRALEAFLKAKRAHTRQRKRWISGDPSNKGMNTTTPTAQTRPQTTSAPTVSWCSWWWWCRRR